MTYSLWLRLSTRTFLAWSKSSGTAFSWLLLKSWKVYNHPKVDTMILASIIMPSRSNTYGQNCNSFNRPGLSDGWQNNTLRLLRIYTSLQMTLPCFAPLPLTTWQCACEFPGSQRSQTIRNYCKLFAIPQQRDHPGQTTQLVHQHSSACCADSWWLAGCSTCSSPRTGLADYYEPWTGAPEKQQLHDQRKLNCISCSLHPSCHIVRITLATYGMLMLKSFSLYRCTFFSSRQVGEITIMMVINNGILMSYQLSKFIDFIGYIIEASPVKTYPSQPQHCWYLIGKLAVLQSKVKPRWLHSQSTSPPALNNWVWAC